MRLRKKHWARPTMEASDLVIYDRYDHKGKWNELFKNNNDIHLELGCGRGSFITKKAELNPDTNFIAIDLKDEVLIYTLEKSEEKELRNIRIIPMNIMLIDGVFNKDEISRIYINFCNPWPKKSHNKRRLTYTSFLETYKKFLKKEGEIWFKTDDIDLFEASIEYLTKCNFKIIFLTYDLHNSDFEGNIMTEYEKKFSSQGMKIMGLIAKLK